MDVDGVNAIFQTATVEELSNCQLHHPAEKTSCSGLGLSRSMQMASCEGAPYLARECAGSNIQFSFFTPT
jgi:hypothetical protein